MRRVHTEAVMAEVRTDPGGVFLVVGSRRRGTSLLHLSQVQWKSWRITVGNAHASLGHRDDVRGESFRCLRVASSEKIPESLVCHRSRILLKPLHDDAAIVQCLGI